MSRRNLTSCRPPRRMTMATAYGQGSGREADAFRDLRATGSPRERNFGPVHNSERQGRRLEVRLDVAEELGALGSVDRAVITRERHRYGRTNHELAVDRSGPVLDRADREDRHLRRIQHGDELLDPVHPEVGDRERPVLEIRQLELPVARTRDDIGTIGGDLLHRLAIRVADDWNDQAARRRDRDPHVRNRKAEDPSLYEVRVDGTMAN